MPKVLWILLMLVIPFTADNHPEGIHPREETPFKKGEQLYFRAMYHSRITGNVTAGDASLVIEPESVMVDGAPTARITGRANTRGMFNLFFKVENKYVSYFSTEIMAPVWFHKTVREGRHTRDADVRFYWNDGKIITRDTVIEASGPVQDLISAYYYARHFDMQSAEPGDSYEIQFFHRDTVYVSRIFFEGREQITTSLGTFNTLRFKPEMLKGQVFSQPYPMTLWVSDDKNKIPIRAESGLVVGRARLDLTGFRGLKNEISSFVP